MKNKSNGYLIIGIIIIIFFIILIVLYLISKKENFEININNNTKVYYINLDKNTKRNDGIINLIKKFDFKNSERISAVNTKNMTDINKYKELISDKSYNDLINNIITKNRKHHYDLTNGSIGCYLSHMKIYEQMVKNNIENALIFEDDLSINCNKDTFWDTISKLSIKSDTDILLLGAINASNIMNEKIINKIDFFFQTHCYFITLKGAKKLLELLLPIKYQIDSALSRLAYEKKINIYILNSNIKNNLQIKQGNDGSDIQTTNCSSCDIGKEIEDFKNSVKF